MYGKVSIIVTSHNGLEYSKKFLESYMDYLTHRPAGYKLDTELLWVDNNSTDGTKQWLQSVYLDLQEQYKCFLLDQNHGAGVARNYAAQRADGDYICFVDNDIRITQVGWIHRLVRTLEETGAGIVAPACNLVDDASYHMAYFPRPSPEYSRWDKYMKDRQGAVFDVTEDVTPYIDKFISICRRKPFKGALVCEGGGSTMHKDIFLDIMYPDRMIVSHSGAYLNAGLSKKKLPSYVDPSVFLFHYGHATRNLTVMPDYFKKYKDSTKYFNEWKDNRQ